MTRLLTAASCAVFGAALVAQSADPPSFEVASVKPNVTVSTSSGMQRLPNGQFLVTNQPLRYLVARAHKLRFFQVSGTAAVLSQRFDINARAADPDADPDEMLRTLLEERFRLQVHRETREGDVYLLVRARRDGTLGPAMKPTALVCSGPDAPRAQPGARSLCGVSTSGSSQRVRIVGGALSTDDIAAAIGNFTGNQMVLDRTGLTGAYDFELEFTPDYAPAGASTDLPVLVTAVQEQLGLRLEKGRGPVEYLVVDRAEPLIPD